MIFLPVKLAFLTFSSIPSFIAIHAAPVISFICEFLLLSLHITRMMLSVSFLWMWELAINTELLDFLEIVFTFNSEEYEQQVDLN
ncbi:Ovule protein [Caenorhabditis elegans]|uniref:Ovule protein n=1 Tax=Caenorhabditis elegans TaxID=6239 RepID=A0A8D9I9K3_CAEEL|nr:Ovule protein [Caenorhabditis elegans]CAG8860232.1 Ovule protein [Caenorhabditis elegans]